MFTAFQESCVSRLVLQHGSGLLQYDMQLVNHLMQCTKELHNNRVRSGQCYLYGINFNEIIHTKTEMITTYDCYWGRKLSYHG
jgi:hypothetical protein